MPDAHDQTTEVKLAVLQTEMAQVLSDVKEINSNIVLLLNAVQRMEIEAATRTAAMARIELEQAYIKTKLNRESNRTRSTDDPLKTTKERAVNVAVITACVVFVIGVLSWVNQHNILSPSAKEAVHQLGEVAH